MQMKKWNINIKEIEIVTDTQEKLNAANYQWNIVKANGKEYRMKYLLDYHHSIIDESYQNYKKIKEKVLKNIEK